MYSVEEIVQRPLRVAGLPARVRNDIPETIAAHWQRFMADRTQVPGTTSRNIHAVYTDYESDYTGAYTLVIGYRVSPETIVPAGLRVVEIPEAKYAIVQARGEQPAAVVAAWQWVWASALKRTYTVDFDEYITDTDVRLHIAVR